MIGYIYLGLDDLDNAFNWFDKAFVERTGWLGFIETDPSFDRVREETRYLELVKKVGL